MGITSPETPNYDYENFIGEVPGLGEGFDAQLVAHLKEKLTPDGYGGDHIGSFVCEDGTVEYETIQTIKQTEEPGKYRVFYEPKKNEKLKKGAEIAAIGAIAIATVSAGALLAAKQKPKPLDKEAAKSKKVRALPVHATEVEVSTKGPISSRINRLRTSNINSYIKKGKENVELRLRSLFTYGKRSKGQS